MLVKGILIGIGTVVCAAVPSVIETHFSQKQMGNSNLPLLVELSIPFLISLIVSAVQPRSKQITTIWIVLAAVAFIAGDVYAIFRVRRGESTLWPVELVIFALLVTGALSGGAALSRTRIKGTQDG